MARIHRLQPFSPSESRRLLRSALIPEDGSKGRWTGASQSLDALLESGAFSLLRMPCALNADWPLHGLRQPIHLMRVHLHVQAANVTCMQISLIWLHACHKCSGA